MSQEVLRIPKNTVLAGGSIFGTKDTVHSTFPITRFIGVTMVVVNGHMGYD